MTSLPTLHPTLGRVIVEEIKSEDDFLTQHGSLYLVNLGDRKGDAKTCRVVAVCDPYHRAEDDDDSSPHGPQFRTGDLVIVGKWQGTEIQVGTRPNIKSFVVLDESSILCTVTYPKEEPSGNAD